MSSRALTRLNPILIMVLLANLVPVPRPAFGVSAQSNAQAAPAPAAALARPATTSPAATTWLPAARPVGDAPRASAPPETPADALPDWFAAPDAGEQKKAALAPPARPTPAALASPWPPSDYDSFVWAATDNAGAWYWDQENGWQQRSGGDLGTDTPVNDVAVSPFDHDVVLAATDDGIYITTTTSSWVSVTLSSNISDASWNALRWDTYYPGVVFATGSRGGPQGYKKKPVWARSTDNGHTWTGGELYEGDDFSWEILIKAGSDVWGAGAVWYIGPYQASGNGTYVKRYWRSLDGGTTWDARQVDSEDWYYNKEKWIAGHVAHPQRVFIAPYGHSGLQGPEPLVCSYSGGDTWTEGDAITYPRHLEYDRTRPGTLWAVSTDEVVRSSDDGESFTTVYNAPNVLRALTLDGYTGRVYAGGPAGGSFDDFVYWDQGDGSWTEPGGMPSPANDNTDIMALSAPQPPYLPGWMLWNPECPFCTAYEAVNHAGDPVDTRDGSFTHNQPGFGLPVLGGSLDFRLTYVSQATGTYTTTLGYGWTHNQAVRLSFPYGISGPLELQGHGGSRLVFGNNGDGTFSPFPGLRAELTRLGTAGAYTYVVTATTQAVYTFDDDGQPLTIQDAQGNVTTFEHEDGQLSRVIGPSSDVDQQRVLDFSYDGQERLIRVTGSLSGSTALSYSVGMAYDGNGDLSTFTDTRGLAWSYTYAGGSHLLTRVTDPNGHDLMQNSYDERGRVTQQLDPLGNALHFGYTLSDTTLLTNALGRVTVDAYDGRGTWAGSVYSNGETITRSYDGNFNLGQTADALGHETAYDWSDGGYDLQQVTDAGGRVTGFGYDARHNLTRSVNARGYTTTYEYDAHNNLITVTDALSGTLLNSYDAYGNLLSTTDQRGETTSYAYDAFGQRTAITDALGLVTRFEYDALGRLITTTQHGSPPRVTLHAYDLGDHLIQSTHNYTSATATQNYQGLWNLVTEQQYDPAGNLITSTDHALRFTLYAYDAANRLVSSTQNYTSVGGIDYGATYNLVTRYGYDAVGNQSVVTDTSPAFGDLITGSRVTRTFYDDLDRPVKTVLNYADGVHDPGRPDEDVVTGYGYDAAGNLITTTDTLGRVTLNEYDTLNRLVKTTLNYTTTTPNPDPATYNLLTTYAYDPVGNVITTTDYVLRFTLYEYDALNRLVKTTANYTTTGGQNYLNQYNLVTRYGYDAAGNRTQITNTQSQITKYAYDALGRLVTITANYTDTPGADPNTYNLTTVYEYDARGNRTRITQPESRTTNYKYDLLDRQTEVQNAAGSVTSYTYDVPGNLTQITDYALRDTNYAYDALGRLLTTTDALSGTTVTAYDPYGNAIRQADARGAIVGVEYDRLGRPRRQVSLEGLDGTFLAQDTFEDASAWTVVTGSWAVENGTYRQSDQGSADNEGMVSLFSGLAVSDFVALVDLKFEATDQPYAVAGLIFRRSADGDESTMVGVRLANAGEWQSGLWSNPDGGLGGPYSTIYRIQGGASLYVEAGAWHRVGVVARGETVILLLDGAPIASWDGDPRESGNVGLITFNSDVRFDNFEVRPLDGYQETLFGYDGLGNRVVSGQWSVVSDQYAIRNTQYAYDGLNRLVAVTDALSHTTQYAYDALGNRVLLTDATGIATRYEYDAAGRLAAVVENTDGGPPTADRNVRTAYGYDALGFRTVVTDALGHTTVYTYDTLGRLAAERDPLGQRTQYAYDALSQRTALTQALGTAEQTVIGYDYDDVGRLLEITYPDPSTGSGQAVAYQYDTVGNRTAMTDTLSTGSGQALGTTRYAYDALYRLTAVTDTYGAVVSYTYDALGQRTGLVYPDGKTVTYTYDALNRLIRVEDWDQGTTRYGYDEAGRLVTATLPNGVQTAYGYDETDRLTLIEHRDALGGLLARYAYELDAVGNRTRVTETQQMPVEGLAALPGGLSAAEVIAQVVGERAPGLAREVEDSAKDENSITRPLWLPLSWSEDGALASTRAASRTAQVGLVAGLELRLERNRLTADGRDGTRLLVLATDEQRQPVADGTHVDLQVTGGRVSPEAAETKGGLVLAQLRAGTQAGSGRVLARAGHVSATISFDLSAPAAGEIRLDDGETLLETPLPFNLAQVVERARNTIRTAPGGLPGVESAGHRARFEQGRLHFAALSGAAPAVPLTLTGALDGVFTETLELDVPLTLTVELVEISIGGQSLFQGPGQAETQLEGNVACYQRGRGLVEEYVARDAGVEQRWRLEDDPGLQGDLLIAVEVETALALATDQTDEGFVFQALDEQRATALPVARYGRALALDAAGRSQRATLWAEEVPASRDGWRRYRLEMRFPAQWLAEARYPLLVDPLISNLLRLEGTFAQDDQSAPQAAYNPDDDEYLVVWHDYRHGTDNPDVYGQRVSGAGVLLGENITVTSAAYRQLYPYVAYAPGGGVYLVAWLHYPGTSDYYFDTYAQLISGTGELSGGPLAIANRSGPTDREAPTDVVYNSTSQQFLVLWSDLRSGYWNVWGRHVSLTGTLAAPLQITFLNYNHENGASGAYDPDDDQYLIAWKYRSSPSAAGDVHARRVTGSGSVTSTETIYVATGGAQQGNQDVVYLTGAGRYLVTWEDNRNSASSGYDVYAQQVAPSGALDGGNYALTQQSQDESAPRLALDGSGGALAVWQQDNGGSDGYDVHGRRLDDAGQPLAAAFAILHADADQQAPAVAGNGAGDYLSTWQDSRKGNWDVYARLVEAGGDLGRDFIVHPLPGDQNVPRVAYNPDDDEYLVVWHDYRHGTDNPDVYGQRVSGAGVLLGENITVTSAAYRQLNPYVAYAPGGGVYLVAWQHFPGTSDYYFDVYGQLISRTGALSGSPLAIANRSGYADREAPTDVVYNSTSQQFLVLWSDLRSSYWNVWGRHVSLTGTLAAPLQITFLSSYHENGASGAYDPDDDQYLILWKYRSLPSAAGDVRGRRMTGGGSVTSTETIYVATGDAQQGNQDVVYLSEAGRYLVVWEDNRDSASSGYDVYGQLVAPTGALDGGNYTIAGQTQDESAPRLALDGSGGALIVWQQDDGGSDGYDVHGRRLDDAGQPLAAPFAILHADADQQAPAVAGNGDGDYLTTWQDNYNGGWDIYAALFRPLQAGFDATPTAGSAPLRVAFTDACTPAAAADQWHWTFGDSSQADGQPTPVHTYTQAGVYTVTQRVTHTATGEWDVLTRTHYVTVSAAAAPDLVTTTITYTYDSLYRLTGADYSSGENFQYQYDATGNRTVYTATLGGTQVTTYTFDAANRLVKVDDVAYTWNALGQLTRDGVYTYTWDAAGRLITVTDGITTLGFLYDGDGNRLARVVNGTLTTHTLDVGLGLPEVLVKHDGGDVTRYLHLPHSTATDDGTAWTYSAADGLGSVRQRLDASGQVAAVNGYRPFGSPLDGGGGEPYGYTGEWWEGDAGLLFLRARYYDPATGRFVSRDPWRGDVWQPGTLHKFLYVGGNPISRIDPAGLQGGPFELDDGLWISSGGKYQMGQLEWGAKWGVAEHIPIFVPPSMIDWSGYEPDESYKPSGFIDFNLLEYTSNAPRYNNDINVNAFGCPQDWETIHYKEGVTKIPEYEKFREWTEPFMYTAPTFNPEFAADLAGLGPIGIIPRSIDARGNVRYTFDWPEQGGGNMEPSTPTPLVFPLVAIYNENPDHSVTINGTYPLRRQWGAPNEIYDGLPGWWFNGISLLSAAGQAAAAWLNAERDAATPRHRIYHLVIQQRESSRRAIIETLKGVNEYASGPKVYRYWLCHTGGRIEEIPINEQPEPAGAVIKPPLNFP